MSNIDIQRSFVIPVIDLSPHSRYNIYTLLNDLESIEGEVICIFNSYEVFDKLRLHHRIDKYCYNNLNAGVSRSWNMGINLSEGRTVFVLNADLHIRRSAVEQLEHYIYELPKAVIIGPQGTHIDFKNLKIIRYFEKGAFTEPVRTHDVSGFFFCIHKKRYLKHKLSFDVRYSPCFMEEWDLGMQVLEAGMACYAVPVDGFDHEWGISQATENKKINYFGRDVFRNDILVDNRKKFLAKWFEK